MDSHLTARRALAALGATALLGGSAVAAAPQHVNGKYKGKTNKGKPFSATVKTKEITKLKVTITRTCQRGQLPPQTETTPIQFSKGDAMLKLRSGGKFGGTDTNSRSTPFGKDTFSTTLKGRVKGRTIKGSYAQGFVRHLSGTVYTCTAPKVTFKGKH